MANIVPPKKKKVVANKVNTLQPIAATEQMPPDAITPLQLKIPSSAKNEFKAYAAMQGKSMNALFIEMFTEHKERHA